MKKYNVTVNGVTYEVMVEEADASSAPVQTAAPAPVKAAAPAPAAAAAPKAPAGPQGSVKVTAPMPGNILKMSIKVGDKLEPNALVCILEAMKMENEIFTKEGGIVKSINAPQGTSVNTGDVIITLG